MIQRKSFFFSGAKHDFHWAGVPMTLVAAPHRPVMLWDLPLDFSVKSEAKIEGELQEMIRQASNGISKEPSRSTNYTKTRQDSHGNHMLSPKITARTFSILEMVISSGIPNNNFSLHNVANEF